MLVKKINRRSFLRHCSNGIIAGALGRTLMETQAFGQEGTLKLLLCTTPNGQFSSEATRQAFSAAISPATLAANALFLEGMNNASTVNENGDGVGDWHGGESALFSFNTSKASGPSFYTALSGLNKAYLGVDVGDRVYARDSSGGQVTVQNDPGTALASVFGGSLLRLNSFDARLVQEGKKSILDPCLDDVKRLRRDLGRDGAMFDDYVYALNAMFKKFNPPEAGAGAGGGGVAAPGSQFEAPTCEKNAGINAGPSVAEKHQGMLDVAYQILACDAAQVTVLSFLNNNSDPQHQFIHSNGSNDGGQRFKQFCDEAQGRIGGLVDRLANGGYNLLDRSAVVYMSEGGAHFINNRFDNQHPQHNIPCAVFGKLGGVVTQTGAVNVQGTNRNLWKAIADGMAGGNANLSDIGGGDVTPLSL